MKVSIYIPTYNRSSLLKRAIDSVLAQTYSNIEICVCSDNSTDGTDLIMEYYCKIYSNIKYIKNIENMGANYTRNNAISLCSGEYLTGLDDDDFFYSTRVSDFVNYLSAYSGREILYSNIVAREVGKVKKIKRKNKVSYYDMLKANFIGNQIFAKKEIFINNGGFLEDLPFWQDKEFFTRVLEKDKIAWNIDSYSYCLDISHEHERITSKVKLEKLKQVEMYFLSRFHELKSSDYNPYFLFSLCTYGKIISVRKLLYIILLVDVKTKLRVLKLMAKKLFFR